MSRILGLDPGFASVGWAVIDLFDSPQIHALGVLRTKKANRKHEVLAVADNFRRARELGRALGRLVVEQQIDVIAAEAMSFPRSSSVAAKMAMCWGVLARVCEEFDLPVVQASPQQIKRALTGRASASKDDVAAALALRFPNAIGLVAGLPAGLHEHAFDAVGAAVACLGGDVVRASIKTHTKKEAVDVRQQ
jgi:crossover junction endodeoxyribonuclease RuvC